MSVCMNNKKKSSVFSNDELENFGEMCIFKIYLIEDLLPIFFRFFITSLMRIVG